MLEEAVYSLEKDRTVKGVYRVLFKRGVYRAPSKGFRGLLAGVKGCFKEVYGTPLKVDLPLEGFSGFL